MSGLREGTFYPWIVLANVLVTTCMAVLSAVATTIADTAIEGELALSHRESVWLTTLYLLGVNTVVPAATWFADRFGYARMYTIGVVLFTLGSGLAGFTNGFAMIAAARLVEGIGGGFIFPIGLAKITQVFPKEQLSLALIMYIGAAFGGGLAFGLPVAGFLSQFYSWRWIFDLILPIGVLATISCTFLHKERPSSERTPFDYWGYLSFATFIATLLIALTYGPLRSTDEGWRSPFIIGSFLIAALSLIATILIEARHAHPIIPLSLFKDPLFTISSGAIFLLGMSIFASITVTVDYMLFGLSYEKFKSGEIAMTYGFSIALSSMLANFLIKRIPAPALTFSGLFFLVGSYFLNNELSWLTGHRQIFWILALRGAGVGLALGPTTVLALQNIPLELKNKAATLLTFFRQVGGTYGSTLIAIIQIKREIFHTARFAEQTSPQLPAYQVTFQKLFNHFYTDVSNKGSQSALQAKEAIIKNIKTQAFITAQNDALLIFGYVTSLMAILLALFLLHRWWKAKGFPTP